MQPGSVISPGSNNDQELQVNGAKNIASTNDTPANTQQNNTPNQVDESSVKESFESTGFDDTEPYLPPQTEELTPNDLPANSISWSASEYIAHHKDASWYLALAGVGLVITTLVFLITEDRITAAVFPVVTLLFGVFAARKPDVLTYEVSGSGIFIQGKKYDFENFKSFSVHEDSSLPSVYFWPTKRFMPGLTVYFPPDQAGQIIDTISAYLPHEEREPDAVDRLMRRIRF